MLSSSLAAGYSMENSFAQAQAQLEEMYGERGMMSKEFAVMRSQLSMNRTLEELWGDLQKERNRRNQKLCTDFQGCQTERRTARHDYFPCI